MIWVHFAQRFIYLKNTYVSGLLNQSDRETLGKIAPYNVETLRVDDLSLFEA